MHPTISEALAKSRQQQFHREAEQRRLARLARSQTGDDRARPAAAVTGMAVGLAARVLRATAGRARGLGAGRQVWMRKRNTAPSPRTGGPWRELSPPRPSQHSRVLVPVPIRVLGALPGDDAGSLTAAARWDAHGPVGCARAGGHGTCARPPHRRSPPGYPVPLLFPTRGMTMCQHQPPCPPARAPDREAARTIAAHPEQGWSLLCNGVVLFDDGGELLPDGRPIEPPRLPGWNRRSPCAVSL